MYFIYISQLRRLKSKDTVYAHAHNIQNINNLTDQQQLLEDESDREQKIIYLRKAFCSFVKAKQTSEMLSLGRVICAILDIEGSEKENVIDSVSKLGPVAVASSALEAISNNMFGSFYSSSPARTIR